MAERHIIGFSSDGNYFAFEEFGIEDGSGFAFSNIYLIDTSRNSWVKGTPVRVRLEQDGAELHDARSDALDKAGDKLKSLGIQSGRKGTLLASNPITELSADTKKVVVVPRVATVPLDPKVTFTIRAFQVASRRCKQYGELKTMGLATRVAVDGSPPKVIQQDERIPKSRGCPRDYRISDVIVYEPTYGKRVYVLLVSVIRLGFEGTERRFLANALWLNAQ